MSDAVASYKVMVLGEARVGKTSIVQRYLFGQYYDCGPPVCKDEERKIVTVDGRDVELIICDTAGQGRVDTLTGQFYKGTHAIIFVYDITDYISFSFYDKWIQSWQRHTDHLPVLFVGNKSDARPPKHADLDRPIPQNHPQDDIGVRLDEEETKKEFVEHSIVKKITKSYNFLSPLECSAKTGADVDKVFKTIARELAMIRPSSWRDKCVCL